MFRFHMDFNKNEAIQAKELAEKKMEDNDFEGALKIALKAQNLCPELDNIAQMQSVCEVHCLGEKKILGGIKDWYGILQVEKFADEQAIKKQFRRMALLLHPDKNRFPGAEGAFKLICEANALLSDRTKRSVYDGKISVLTRSAPVNPPDRHMNRSSQPNKPFGAQYSSSNGSGSLNQHQATQPTFSSKLEVLSTCCPYCKAKYQYLRQYVNRAINCRTCEKIFIFHEVSARGIPSGSMGPQHVQVPPKPAPSQPQMGMQNAKGSSASHTGSEGTATQKTIPTQPGVRMGCAYEGVKVASAAGNFKPEEKDSCSASSSGGGKRGEVSDDDPIYGGGGDLGKKIRKRGRKLVVESSDGSDTEIEDLIMQEDDQNCQSTGDQSVRRSSRQRSHVSYKETDEDALARFFRGAQASKADKGKEKKDVLDTEDLKHDNQHNFPAASDYCKSGDGEMGACSQETLMDKNVENHGAKSSGIETIEIISDTTIEIISDTDGDASSGEKSEPDMLECPDPEFSDFDTARDENNFGVNQFWACYDQLDGMPRFYAKVKKVCASPFELHIAWLEVDPIDETYDEWVDEELPVSVGSFTIGKTEKTSARLQFSHQVHCEKGKKRGSLTMYPIKGEIWALFRDWDKNWSSDPENHKEFKYEIVEVLSDFVAGVGIEVSCLNKVTGFVSLFQRASQNGANSFLIAPDEVYKFSHGIPFFIMTGAERQGVPVGSFELDPACLPLNPDDLYHPSKKETARKNMDGKDKGTVVSQGPQNFFDLDEIDE